MTGLVKMDFEELRQLDPKLLHHTRLLHSMVGERGRACGRAGLAWAGSGGTGGHGGLP